MSTDDIELEKACDELLAGLRTHGASFDAKAFVKQVEDKTPPEEREDVKTQLLAVWGAWYVQQNLRDILGLDI